MNITAPQRAHGRPVRSRRLLATVAAVAAVGLALVGCSASNTPSASSTAKGTLGFVTFDSTSVAAASESSASISALKAAGWDVVSQDAKGDPANGNTICNQYVTRQVKAIVVSVFQLNQMAQCMNAADTAKIPVFYLDSSLSSGMAGAISTASPKPVNDLMVAAVKKLTDPQILVLQYSPATPSQLRSTYMRDQLKKAGVPDSAFTVHEVQIPGQVVDSQNATQAWLAKHPDASDDANLVIWTSFSDAAVGALAALGDRKIPIYTWDLTKQSVKPLEDGTFVATSLADPKGLAKQLVTMISDKLAGGKAQGLDAPAVVLTKDNIDSYLKANPDAAQ
jgi:ABC-type sugar transport system substrate-binding protein